MPSAVPTKCRGSVVRQLSLQNQSPLQSPGCPKLKKQLSEDDSRFLDPVEITGQGWMANRPESAIRIGNLSEGKIEQVKVGGEGRGGFRPKPAKLAWSEKKQENAADCCPEGVEVVATKFQGQPRPLLSIKNQRFRTPLIGNKDTLAYTRLQLAERLRSAWSEREKSRPNLNIFLAHSSDTSRSDNPPSERQLDTASMLSDALEKKRKSLQIRAFPLDPCLPDLSEDKFKACLSEVKRQEDDGIPGEKGVSDPKRTPSDEEASGLQELSKIEIRVVKTEPNESIDSSGDEENFETRQKRGSQEENLTGIEVEPVMLTAKDRRANFRSSNILHKTIVDGDEEEKTEEVKKSNLKKPPLLRAFSAPSQDQTRRRRDGQQRTVRFCPQERLLSFSNRDACSATDASQPEDVTATHKGRIKSAPVRRKLRTTAAASAAAAAARKKNKEKTDLSSEEEKEEKEKKNTPRRRRMKNGSDIVTMVSLVSPAESDTEESVINLPVESTLAKGGEKDEASAEAKPSTEQQVQGASFVVQKFVSLRKTTKTVTFQAHPGPTRNYSASFPSRRAPAGTPVIVPCPVIANPALTPAQLQERERRGQAADGRGVKRRLTRSSSEPSKGDDLEENRNAKTDSSTFAREMAEDSFGGKEKFESEYESEEPQFKCPKEKECWALYKKMLAKGVSITFDTVLRGMLTPTEYRLKRNHLLSTC